MKHAFCIVAHNDYELLEKLIRFLDSEGNDIFIHIDRRVSLPNCEYLKAIAKASNVYFTDRVDVAWGELGIFLAEFQLLKESEKKEQYDYFHLLSGQDFLLKSVDELDKFLEDNIYSNSSNKKYYTNYIEAKPIEKKIQWNCFFNRICHYNFFIRYWRHKNKIVRDVIKILNICSNTVQTIIGVNRLKNTNMKLYEGSTWYSLSNEFVKFVVKNEEWIHKYFTKTSFAVDEAAMQILFMNSKYATSQFNKCKDKQNVNLRYIDFERGNGASPYVFKSNDYTNLKSRNDFFARKFSPSVDMDIVDALIKDNSIKKEDDVL